MVQFSEFLFDLYDHLYYSVYVYLSMKDGDREQERKRKNFHL